MNNGIREAFLGLLKLGISHGADSLLECDDWNKIRAYAERQGLSAVVLDGVEYLPENKRPSKEVLLEWIGEALQGYEYRYGLCRRAISELAEFYNSHGIQMMVLKGYACSLDWPKPEHRPCGDIDIWLLGKQKEGDDALEQEKPVQIVQGVQKFKVEKSHHHHTVFNWKGFTVENHYDFVNVHAHKSSAELEKIFKELGQDDTHFVEIKSAKVYLPSPNLHALFLIRHMVSHFASSEINLRQVLDWAFFVENHKDEVDWNWLDGMLEKYHMKEFVSLVNAICVEDLGFPVDIFSAVKIVRELKERVLEDILDPEYTAAEPKGFFPRVIYKYKRWQGNAWKQEMCYGESRWFAFWSGIWAKILKPASI